MHGSLLVVIIVLVLVALGATPARADYYQYTGTLSFPTSTCPFLPSSGPCGAFAGNVSVSGSGVAWSSVVPNQIELATVQGFTGTLSTTFVSSVGYRQEASITRVGAGKFSQPTVPGPLYGKMGVGGQAQRRVFPKIVASIPALTASEATGLGLGGKLGAKGQWALARFGLWTTGTVIESSVVVESHPVIGTVMFGTLSAMGFDARTPDGMGEIQFVTPIRVDQKVAPSGDRAAIGALTLNFAPEPGRLALFASGCLALVLIGATRSRSD